MRKAVLLLICSSVLFFSCSSDNSPKDNEDPILVVPKGDFLYWDTFKVNELYGFYDTRTNEIIIKPRFTDANRFTEFGLALVETKGKWGVIDYNGKTIVKPTYDYMVDFDYRGFSQIILNEKRGIIDTKGRIILEPINDEIGNINAPEGAEATWIRRGNKYAIVNHDWKLLTDFIYDYVSKYEYGNGGRGYHLVQQKDKYGLLNDKGEFVLPVIYDKVGEINNDGISRIEKEKKIGLYDIKGRIIEPKYDRIEKPNYDGYFKVVENGKWGMLDKEWKVYIEPKFTDDFSIGNFADKSITELRVGDKWGMIDRNFNVVIEPIYEDIYFTWRGFIAVKQNGKYGLANYKGKLVTEIEYKQISVHFQENGYMFLEKNGKYDVFHSSEKLLKGEFDECRIFNWDSFNIKVRKNNKWALVDSNVNIVTGFDYTDITFDSAHPTFFWLKNDREIGLVNDKGNFIIPLKRANSISIQSGRILVRYDNKLEIYDLTGQLYDSINVSEFRGIGSKVVLYLTSDYEYVVKNYISKTILYRADHRQGYLEHLGDNFILVQKGKKAILNGEGKFISDFVYDYIDHTYYVYNKLFLVGKGEKLGLLSKEGKVIIEPNLYTYIGGFDNEGIAQVHVGNKVGHINRNGQLIRPLE